MMPTLLVDRVFKTRGLGAQAVEVLHGVSFSAAAGEFVLLEGPSGAGKTTLLAVAGGILTPESGSVVLAGRPLHVESRRCDRRARARSVGFVFQRSNLLPGLSARDNILLMGRIAGLPARETAAAADDLLERLGLGRVSDRRPHELSCGEEQRVAVARALVNRPAVVLADEPTGNLDSLAGQAVAEGLAEQAARFGSAVVVATHDSRLASFADRRVRIEDGRIRD